MIRQIEPSELDSSFHKFEPYINSCIKHSGIDIDIVRVYELIKDGLMQLFDIYYNDETVGCMVTEVNHRFGNKVLVIVFASSDSRQVSFDLDMMQLEHYCKASDINRIEFFGRRGFMKWKKISGYEPSHILFSKNI